MVYFVPMVLNIDLYGLDHSCFRVNKIQDNCERLHFGKDFNKTVESSGSAILICL